jgi:hypothetical protein
MYKVELGVNKKTEKPSKPRKKTKKTEPKKKSIIFFVKFFCSVQFWFTKSKTSKTPTELNRFGLRGTINTKKNTLSNF